MKQYKKVYKLKGSIKDLFLDVFGLIVFIGLVYLLIILNGVMF